MLQQSVIVIQVELESHGNNSQSHLICVQHILMDFHTKAMFLDDSSRLFDEAGWN